MVKEYKPVGMKRQFSLMKPKFVSAVYTRKSIKKRIFEANDTIHSLLENDKD